MAKRILVIANKTWECAPLVSALFSPRSRPEAVHPIERGYDPEIRPLDTHELKPRATLVVEGSLVQLWCIEDCMDPGAGSSNTVEKMRVLPRIFAEARAQFGDPPDVVIAFGTAGIPAPVSFNGSVTVGSRVFVHDPFGDRSSSERVLKRKDGKTDPMWTSYRLDEVLESSIGNWLRTVPDTVRSSAEARFVRPPIRAGEPMTALVGNGFAALSTVNVMDYDDYVWADPQALAAFREAAIRSEVGSQETTHGLIRIAAEAALATQPRFLYVSGITDSAGLFDMDVTPRAYAQNFAAAHNAGVALAWLLPELAAL